MRNLSTSHIYRVVMVSVFVFILLNPGNGLISQMHPDGEDHPTSHHTFPDIGFEFRFNRMMNTEHTEGLTTIALLLLIKSEPNVIRNGKLVEQDRYQEELLNSIKGKTLEVYSFMMERGGELGVREIQKELGYSSPNLAYYHVNKLVEAGIVDKTPQNKYLISEETDTKLGQYKHKINLNGYWMSNYILHAFLFVLLSLVGIILLLNRAEAIIWGLIFIPAMLGLAYENYRKYHNHN